MRPTKATRLTVPILLLAAALPGCRKAVKPGLGVRGVPTGGAHGRATVTATFDRDMVKLKAVGTPLATSPLVVRPRVAGKTRWADTRTLTFTPAEDLPRATRFTAEIEEGTVALDGHGLPDGYRWSFETPRLHGSATLERERPDIDPRRWAGKRQPVHLTFSQPVGREAVERWCRYHASGPQELEVAAVLETDRPAPAPGVLRAVPAEDLAPATDWTFRCEQALSGLEGPLGMKDPIGLELRTIGPMQVVSIEPNGVDVGLDEVELVIELTNPPKDFGKHLSISPRIKGFPERATLDGQSRIHFRPGPLPHQQRYTVEVAAGLEDVFGQRLAMPVQGGFQTGDATPRVDVETGLWAVESAQRDGFPLWARNVASLDVTAAAVPAGRLHALLAAVRWWNGKPVDLQALGIAAVRRAVPVQGRENKWDQVQLRPAELLGGEPAPHGIYYMAVSAKETAEEDGSPPRVQEVLVDFTDLGVISKLSGPSGLVWVTRLSDGAPVAGAEVEVRTRGGKQLWKGRTGPDGVAETPGLAALKPGIVPAPPPPPPPPTGDAAEEDEEDDDYPWWGLSEQHDTNPSGGLLVFARAGDDVAFVDPQRAGGLSPWQFGVSPDWSDEREALRGFLHTDRGLYRPGETVHVRGLARVMALGERLRVPKGATAKVTVRDPRGDQVHTETLTLSRYGGFSFDLPLEPGARLGDWRVLAEMPVGTFSETFSVEEYRPRTVEVKVAGERPWYVAGDTLKATASAAYLFGAPVRAGKVTWTVSSTSLSPSFDGYEGFEFTDARTWWDEWGGGDEWVTEESGELDGEGVAAFEHEMDASGFEGGSRRYVVSARVTDETHQTVTGRLAVPIHRSAVYFGVRRPEYLVEAGSTQAVALVAVDPDGKRVAAQARVRLQRRSWACAWESWGFHGSYRCDRQEEDVHDQEVKLGADVPLTVPMTPPRPGQYFVIVEGKDARGNATTSADTMWVYGDGDPPWRAEESSRFEVVADKKEYAPGDTARLLLQTTMTQASGMLTIEREGVLERRPFTLAPGGGALEVPIQAGWGPNVYASVLLVRGRSGPGVRGLPRMRMGMVNLRVAVPDRRLQVDVATDAEGYRPGDTVTATVKLTDAAGGPVRGEVALAAADEGVLQLIGYETPDPMRRFYAPWGLGVKTAAQHERLAKLPEPDTDRYATGGDSPGAPGTLRSRMRSTAYWSPALETGPDGTASVTFEAPDNLTAFRLMAVAADDGDRFGSGERRFTVSKPLQIISALPRFLNTGDDPRGAVMITNETGAAGTAVVTAAAQGVALVGEARREVPVEAGGRARVEWPLRVEQAGTARLTFTAELGAERDGLAVELPVQVPAPVETMTVAQGSTEAATQLTVQVPAGVIAGSGTLELSADRLGLAGLEGALRSLIEYPHGCLEQTTSRLIPLVMVGELAEELDLASLKGEELQRFIDAGIARLGRFQSDSGGFSLWQGGHPEIYYTAFALWGLHLAREAGHAVSERRVDAGAAWLARRVGEEPDSGGMRSERGELGSRAFALHVLALLGKPEAGHVAALMERRGALPRYGLAMLVRALAATVGAADASVTATVGELLAGAERSDKGTVVREAAGKELYWYMSDDARTTAIVTDTVLALQPDHAEVPELVRGVLSSRSGASWGNTQSTLYSLVALTHYARRRSREGEVRVRFEQAGETLLDGVLGAKGLGVQSASVPLARLKAGQPVEVHAQGGRAFYAARLRFRREVAHQTARAEGITVQLEYLDPESEEPVGRVPAGALVQVRVHVTAADDLSHVAVVDRLPAGLEVVNPKLQGSPEGGGSSDEEYDEYEDYDDEQYWMSSTELRDDRVAAFGESFWQGPHVVEYVARATTVGRFVAPAATAEAMYRPHVNGQTAPATFEVVPR